MTQNEVALIPFPAYSTHPKVPLSLILEKSLLYKLRSLTRVHFNTEAHKFPWDEDLKRTDEEALTFGDVRTFLFLAIGFFGRPFFG